MSESLRSRLARLTGGTNIKNQMARTAFTEYVPVTIEESEYAEYEPSNCGFIGRITIRATTYERYRAKIAELRADGAWDLLEC